jgi:hypothetical protein
MIDDLERRTSKSLRRLYQHPEKADQINGISAATMPSTLIEFD